MAIRSMGSRMATITGGGGGGSAAVTGTLTCGVSGAASQATTDVAVTGLDTAADDLLFTFKYKIQNEFATLWLVSGGDFTGTSDATTFSILSFPAALRPVATVARIVSAVDNGNVVTAEARMASNGTMTMAIGAVSGTQLQFSVTGWTNSGSKGMNGSFHITYPLT